MMQRHQQAAFVWFTMMHCCIICFCHEYGDHHPQIPHMLFAMAASIYTENNQSNQCQACRSDLCLLESVLGRCSIEPEPGMTWQGPPKVRKLVETPQTPGSCIPQKIQIEMDFFNLDNDRAFSNEFQCSLIISIKIYESRITDFWIKNNYLRKLQA